MQVAGLAELGAAILEAAGVGVIVLGSALAAVLGVVRAFPSSWDGAYPSIRQGVGRAILLGLELLVGADILRTVATEPTLRSVAVLGGVVLIRTFLSFTLEVELTGAWPWQQNKGGKA